MGYRRLGDTPAVNPTHAVITAVTAIVSAVTAYVTWSVSKATKTPTDTTGSRR